MEKQKLLHRIGLGVALFCGVMLQFGNTVEAKGGIQGRGDTVLETQIQETDAQDLFFERTSSEILGRGGLLKEREIDIEGQQEANADSALYSSNSVQKTLLNAANSYTKEVNLKSYGMTPDEVEWEFVQMLNNNPRLFYVDYSFYYMLENNKVTRFQFVYTYSKEQTKQMLTQYDSQIEEIFLQVDSRWSEMEKVLFFNDYLTRNCAYDTNYEKYDAYNVFVEKTAVCQGYALAMKELCDRANITSCLVTSDTLNHAWNLVKINGKYYHVDSTWNDPVFSFGDFVGYAGHEFFMKSSKYFHSEKGNHIADDYAFSTNVTENLASDTTYDTYFWDDVINGFEYIDGYWYGIYNNEIQKYRYTSGKLNRMETIHKFEDSNYALGLSKSGKYLYYATTSGIVRLNPIDKSKKVVWKLTNEEAGTGSFQAFYIKYGDTVVYFLVNVETSTFMVNERPLIVYAMSSGHTISLEDKNDLSGDFQLNCYFNLFEDTFELSDVVWQYQYLLSGETVAVPVDLKELKQQGEVLSDGSVEVRLSCPVTASKISEPIQLTLGTKDKTFITYQYSVKDYVYDGLEYLDGIQNQNQDAIVALRELYYSILDYGTYAQKYFNYNNKSELLANGKLSRVSPVEDKQIDVYKETFGKYESSGFHQNSKAFFYGASLVCGNSTDVKLYFKLKGNESPETFVKDYRIEIGDKNNRKAADYQIKDDMIVVTVKNIPILKLSEYVEVTITNKQNAKDAITLQYSPMAYISKASNSKNDNLKKLARAMYFYHSATKSYFLGSK